MKKWILLFFLSFSVQADPITGSQVLNLYDVGQKVTLQVVPGTDPTHQVILIKYDQIINGISVRECLYTDGTWVLNNLSGKGNISLFSLLLGGIRWNDAWCNY